jgi:hypothetical protein
MTEMTLLDLQDLEIPETENHGGGGDSELSVTGCNGHSGISLLCAW